MSSSLLSHGLHHAKRPCPLLSLRVFSNSWPWASLVAQSVKNSPSVWETWVQSLGWEDSLEEGMATHSSIIAWRIPMDREPGGIQSMESQRVGHDWLTKHLSTESVMPSTISCRPLLLLPQPFPASRSFPMSQFFTSGIGASASASVLPMNI